MKPDPQEPADLLNLLRQQLLLAQVRIMELEDTRDELAPRLAETAALLAAAQSLAELKVDEAAHLEKVRADLQTRFDHLRHVQHETNQALEGARADLEKRTADNAALLSEVEQLHLLTRQLAEAERAHLAHRKELEATLAGVTEVSTGRAARIQQLDRERHAMKASRSWRWTAWLRSLERLFK